MPKMPIEVLFTAFQTWQADQLAMTREYPASQWGRRMQELRDNFRAELEEYGAADVFDWTDLAEAAYRAATGKDDPGE